MSYTVTFKKVFTRIEADDETEAEEEATHKLHEAMSTEMGIVDDFFETEAQKEPVKEITITEGGIKQFLETHYMGVELTEEQIKKFMDYLELDVTEWLKSNLQSFMENRDD